MRCVTLLTLVVLIAHTVTMHAEDADEVREKGIAALKDSQTNPRAIVDAARFFVRAAALYGEAGNEEKNVEMKSFLYWCKKKMTLADIEQFIKGGEDAVASKLAAVEKAAPKADDAQKWFDRAGQFATKNPDEHLLIAIRYFEVADRFKGTDTGHAAIERSLNEMQRIQAPNVAPRPEVAAPPAVSAAVTNVVREAVPSQVKLKDAEKTIKDIFKDDYAKRSAEDRKAFGCKLLQQAFDTKNDMPALYVLLREASATAASTGDAETAVKAIDALAVAFEIDAGALKADALAKVGIAATSTEQATALAHAYLVAVEDSVVSDNYDAALKMITTADTVARKAQDISLVTQLQTRAKEIRLIQTEFSKVKTFQSILKEKPDDPDASLTAGKFFCFTKREWGRGLPLLAKGNDVKLKELAEKDVGGTDPVGTGDGWWDYGDKLSVALKTSIQGHAVDLYDRGSSTLNGLAKAKVEKRILEFAAREPLSPINLLREHERGKWKDLVGRGTWASLGKEGVQLVGVGGGGPDLGWSYPIPNGVSAFTLNMTFRLAPRGGVQIVFEEKPDILSGHGVCLAYKWQKGFSVGDLDKRPSGTKTVDLATIDKDWHSLVVKVLPGSIRARLDSGPEISWSGKYPQSCITVSGDEFEGWYMRDFTLTPMR